MANRKKIFRISLYVLLIVLVLIQFIRPEHNTGGDKTLDISTKYEVPERVQTILDKACMDCHGNTTKYPWYSKIQPVAWYLAEHVEDGKKHLNFNEFMSYKPKRQYHKMEEVDEVISADEMPLTSYTWMHSEAKLSKDQKEILINWSKDVRASMKSQYSEEELED